MRKKIQKTMILLISVTLIAAYILTIIFVYARVRSIAVDNIEKEAQCIAAGVQQEDNGAGYLKLLDEQKLNIRVTLIQEDGNVLFDSDEDAAQLENHLHRPEVQKAIKDGSGLDVRRSATMSRDMIYYALALSDGEILRVAQSASSVTYTALQLFPVMTGVLIVMLLISGAIIRAQAGALIRPINSINLDEPLENDIYEELTPLLKRIDKQNKEKEETANMRKEFSANVSHELKTPLTSISGYAEIMKNGLVKSDDMQKFSERIYNESQRMIALVDDIIKLSKLDEGEVQYHMEDVNLLDLSRSVVETLQEKAQRCSVHVEVFGENCSVLGVRQLLQEMIYNLVDNAIKYNREGGKVKVVIVRTVQGTRLTVSDSGIGIPQDQLERVFERFYRVDKSRSKERGGTGLGLSIVKHGAAINHAKIGIESRLGQGTTIDLTFPNPG